MIGKIFRNTFVIGLSVLLLCAVLFFGLQYRKNIDDTYESLEREAAYAASGMALSGEVYLRSLQSEDRLTWIAADGAVLYDSGGAAEGSQRDCPEVQEAFSGGNGQSTRESAPGGVTTMYYAVRLTDGTVLRLSRPVQAAWSALVTVSPVLWVTVLVVLLSSVLSFRIAKQILRPVNEIDLDHPDASKTYSELAPLVSRIEEQNLTIRDQMDELNRRQKEFAALTDSMREGFLLIDRRSIILSANSSALQLLPEGEIGDELLAHADDTTAAAVKEALAGKRTEAMLSHGGQSWQLIASPVVSHGQVSGAVVLLMDVTEREQRERLRQEFSANVSHELKTPLTSISGFAELMMQGIVPSDKVMEFSGDIYRESRRLLALVEDIIKLSKLDEEAGLPEKEEVDLYDLAADTLDSLRAVADRQQVSLRLEGGPAVVSGVPHLLSEMLYNLCDNAIKYNREGGRVTVDVTATATETRLSVADTGIGIPYADQNRVFERFYRVDKSHSKEIGGTGLGLSIVKHGAQLCGASIELDSTPGEGTTISLIFPKM